MNIVMSIKYCRECPHVTNSAREHDCAFTSQPHPTVWWCKIENGPEIISDEWTIDSKCPFKENND